MKKVGSGWVWWVGVVLGVIVAGKTAGNISRLMKIQAIVGRDKENLVAAETENSVLKRKLVEVQTADFVEREAREKLGMGREGERVVIMPEKTKSEPSFAKATEGRQENWRLWRKLYLGF